MRISQGSANPFANAASMVVQSVLSPGEEIAINLPEDKLLPSTKTRIQKSGSPRRAVDAATGSRQQITASSYYMWTLFIVLLLTVAAGGVYIAMAFMWISTTPNQQAAFETMGTAGKMGFGALVGLLGGKTLR
jgi:hypothetical protein